MRATTRLIAVLGIMAGLLLTANMVLRPPLAVEPRAFLTSLVQKGAFSEPALGGLRHYTRDCAQCHGVAAEGTSRGPGLRARAYADDFRNSAMFHGAIGRDIPAHRAMKLRRVSNRTADFNRLERIAKFLRELRRTMGR